MAKNYMDSNRYLSRRLKSEAEEAGIYTDPTAKGDGREVLLHKVLRERIGVGFGVTKGEVLDAEGNTSNEFDTVIYDRTAAAALHTTTMRQIVRVESVVMVVEVKSRLTKDDATKASDSVRSSLAKMQRLYEKNQLLRLLTPLMKDADEVERKLENGVGALERYKGTPPVIAAVFAYEGPEMSTAKEYLELPHIDTICVLQKYTISRAPTDDTTSFHGQEFGRGEDALGGFLAKVDNAIRAARANSQWVTPDTMAYFRPRYGGDWQKPLGTQEK